MLPSRKSKPLVIQRKRSLSDAIIITPAAHESPAVGRTTSESSVPSHHTPPKEDLALLTAAAIVSLKVEATVSGKHHTLWLVLPDTTQLAVFQLENHLRNHLR